MKLFMSLTLKMTTNLFTQSHANFCTGSQFHIFILIENLTNELMHLNKKYADRLPDTSTGHKEGIQ